VSQVGTIEKLTEQLFNKIGPTPDAMAANPVVGSLVPFP
jgi:hypothetical protein